MQVAIENAVNSAIALDGAAILSFDLRNILTSAIGEDITILVNPREGGEIDGVNQLVKLLWSIDDDMIPFLPFGKESPGSRQILWVYWFDIQVIRIIIIHTHSLHKNECHGHY